MTKIDHIFESEELKFLDKRGYLKQITHPEKLDEKFKSGEKICFYIGFDCTAKSLHVGHLIPIMIARYLVKMGHKAIIILGTTTAKIGDPSGKSETRKILSTEEICENFYSLSKLIKKFLMINDDLNEVSKNILFLENNWLENVSLVEFLREYGVHFSVNRMLAMETFKRRLEDELPLSFLEFTYSLFQAYDFFHLNQKYNCVLQIGGSDQWGNIVAGLDFGHKMNQQGEFFGLTCNLLVNSSGQKMGKTINGAVWLDENLLSPFEYWQYFRNIDDADVKKIFYILSDFEFDEIEKIFEQNKDNINDVKISLATILTEICHGKKNALEVAELAKQKFSFKKENYEDLTFYKNLEVDFYLKKSKNDEMSSIDSKKFLDLNLSEQISILDLLKICVPENSNTEFRKLAKQNALKLNGKIIDDISENITPESHFIEKKMFIEIGKKKKFVFSCI